MSERDDMTAGRDCSYGELCDYARRFNQVGLLTAIARTALALPAAGAAGVDTGEIAYSTVAPLPAECCLDRSAVSGGVGAAGAIRTGVAREARQIALIKER